MSPLKKVLLALSLSLLLQACGTFERPITKEHDRDTTLVTVFLFDREEDMYRVCESDTTRGCAFVYGTSCIIYTMKPKTFDSPRLQTLGHELYHCLGADHP